MNPLRQRLRKHVAHRGAQTIKTVLRHFGSKQQQQFAEILEILTDYENDVQKKGYYAPPFDELLAELDKHKKMVAMAFMPGQTAGAQFLFNVIKAKLIYVKDMEPQEQKAYDALTALYSKYETEEVK